jgi:hypothetical protein
MQSSKHPDGPKHHYIPVFYLKQWSGSDGRLCEFSKPHNVVKPRRIFPDGTGYQRGLYTFSDLPPATAEFLETQFLLLADDKAHSALRRLLENEVVLDDDSKSAWSRFLMTLFHRTPEGIARMRRRISSGLPSELERFRPQYEELKDKHGGPPFADFCARLTKKDMEAFTLRVLHQLMDSGMIGNALNSMKWGVLVIDRSPFSLLT